MRRVVQLFYFADEPRQRTGIDAHVVAHGEIRVHDDRFELHFAHFVVFQRQRPSLRADKARDAPRIRDEVPYLVGIDHLDEDIAGQKFPFHHFALAVLFFDGLLHRYFQIEYTVLQIVVFDEPFKAVFDHRFIPRISMKDVPLSLAFG